MRQTVSYDVFSPAPGSARPGNRHPDHAFSVSDHALPGSAQKRGRQLCLIFFVCIIMALILSGCGKKGSAGKAGAGKESAESSVSAGAGTAGSAGSASTGTDTGISSGDESTSSEKEEVSIGLCFDSFVIERWLRDRDVFTATAQELGAKVNVQNANGDVEEQISQIRYLIDRGVDVIVVIAIDGEKLQEVVKEAKDKGILVVSYDRLIKNAGTDLYISFDNEMVGTMMGEALCEALPDGGEVFEILGSESDNNVAQVRQGFEKAIEGSGITITHQAYCQNWLPEIAAEEVSKGLQENGDRVDGVMCGNDGLAGQAIRVLTEHRLAGRVPVTGQDGDLSACQRIVEGTQTMTVYKNVVDEARIAAKLSVALARGENITGEDALIPVPETISDGTYDIPYYGIAPVAVTADNMDSVIIDSGFHLREDVYMNVQGKK